MSDFEEVSGDELLNSDIPSRASVKRNKKGGKRDVEVEGGDGLPEGFTPMSSPPPGTAGIRAVARPSATELISRPQEDGSVDIRPRTEMHVDEPVIAAPFSQPSGGGPIRSMYNRGVELSCEAKQTGTLRGKCSGKATHTVSGPEEDDLTTVPWALCPRHIGKVQDWAIKNGEELKITPITPAYVDKHRAKVKAINMTKTLSMESLLRSGGLETSIPEDAEKPPVETQVGARDLLFGRNTTRFGVRGESLDTHLDRVKQRRTPEDAEAILSNALTELRNNPMTLDERDKDLIGRAEQAQPDTDRRTGTWMPWSFNPRDREGLLRANKVEFVQNENGIARAVPGKLAGKVDTTSTWLDEQEEEPRVGTNVSDRTVNSVDFGSRADVIANLPAHLVTSLEGTAGEVRPLTPLERFSEAHYDENDLAAASQARIDSMAEENRRIEGFRNMPKEQRLALEKEMRGRKALEFKQGSGQPELE